KPGWRRNAISAPRSTIAGARKPPIASRASVMSWFTAAPPLAGAAQLTGFGPLCRHFAAVVIAAGGAQMMRPLQLAAVGAFGIGRGFKGMMRAPHVAARGRGFLLRN